MVDIYKKVCLKAYLIAHLDFNKNQHDFSQDKVVKLFMKNFSNENNYGTKTQLHCFD